MLINSLLAIQEYATLPASGMRWGTYGGPATITGLYFVFMLVCFCLMFFLAILVLVANVFFIIDALRRDFGEDKNQVIVWILVLLFAGFPVGMLLYYFLVFKKYPLK